MTDVQTICLAVFGSIAAVSFFSWLSIEEYSKRKTNSGTSTETNASSCAGEKFDKMFKNFDKMFERFEKTFEKWDTKHPFTWTKTTHYTTKPENEETETKEETT